MAVSKNSEQTTGKEIRSKEKDRWTRLTVNLSPEVAEMFRDLVERKGLSITDGVRTAIKIWKFLEDEIAAGNQLATIEPDKTVHKVFIVP